MFLQAIIACTFSITAWTHAQVQQQSSPRSIVFICEHGAAKSVIAAAYFNKLAAERHLNFHAIARGVTPQPGPSTSTIAGLKKDGLPVTDEKPRALSRQDVQHAVRVVAFCPVPTSLMRRNRVSSFDVPEPKDGYDASRDAIIAHVKKLINELAAETNRDR